jgi:hypothetical protein
MMKSRSKDLTRKELLEFEKREAKTRKGRCNSQKHRVYDLMLFYLSVRPKRPSCGEKYPFRRLNISFARFIPSWHLL